MSKRTEILKQAGVYSAGTIITQFITLVAAVLTRRFLGPSQMGIWSTLQVLVDYSKYTSLGVMSAVTVEIPYAVGKRDQESAENIKNTAFAFVLTSAVAFSCLILLVAFFIRHRLSPEVTNGLLLVTAIIFLQRINNLLIALLRCYKKFEIEAGQMIWSSIVNAVLIAVFAYRFKLYGFIFAMSLSYVFNIAYLLIKFHFKFLWKCDRVLLRRLTVFGFPLMLLGLMTVGLKSIDRIIIAKMLGFKALGFYSIALMACSFISNFYSAAAVVFLPHYQEKFSEKDNPKDLEKYIFKASTAFSIVMPLFFSAVWIFIPYVISVFLPQFRDGVLAMKLLSLSVFFVALTHPYQDFLVTVKKHVLLFPILIFSSAAALVLDYYAIRMGYGIDGVAAMTSLVFFINFTVLFFVASRHFTDLKTAINKYFIYVSLFVYSVAVLVINVCWLFRNDLLLSQITFRAIFFLIVYAPLLYILNKQFSIVSFLKNKSPQPI